MGQRRIICNTQIWREKRCLFWSIMKRDYLGGKGIDGRILIESAVGKAFRGCKMDWTISECLLLANFRRDSEGHCGSTETGKWTIPVLQIIWCSKITIVLAAIVFPVPYSENTQFDFRIAQVVWSGHAFASVLRRCPGWISEGILIVLTDNLRCFSRSLQQNASDFKSFIRIYCRPVIRMQNKIMNVKVI
jgi:hypothetical protein